MRIQLVGFAVQCLFFNEAVRIYEQGNNSVGQYGQYIPALTSHSVNKSIFVYY